MWDNKGSNPRRAGFEGYRFTVKIVSEKRRIITRMVGDTAGTDNSYGCRQILSDGRIACDEYTGAMPWDFSYNNRSYTRAYLAGPPPAGGTPSDPPNIAVAYGICTKF
jgi:hypothetical protein